jgi:acetyl esterase/lipase
MTSLSDLNLLRVKRVMSPAAEYGTLPIEAAKPPATATCLNTLKTALPLALLIALIVVLVMAIGSIVLYTLVPIVVTMYALLFASFCYYAWPFATSFVLVPYIALKTQFKLLSLLAEAAGRGFKPTFPEWTLTYELTISLMRYSFLDYGHVVADVNAHRLRGPFALHGRTILKSCCRKHKTIPEKLVANGMEHMWMRDPEKKEHRVVVIHYHGGGYCISDPLQDVELANQEHTILKQLLKDTYHLDVSVDVLLVNYRMAPEFLYPVALNDCFDMYKYVLEHESVAPSHVVFSGDSAGAEMSMTNCMRLRKESPELQPAAALCYSPVVDFSETDNDEKTPYCILAANFADNCLATYTRSVTDPEQRRLISPINHSLRDLPPIFLQWGDQERFYEQGLRFKAKADAEGVTNMELDVLKNIVHDPVMFPTAVSPAAEKAITSACAFAAKYLAPVLREDATPV